MEIYLYDVIYSLDNNQNVWTIIQYFRFVEDYIIFYIMTFIFTTTIKKGKTKTTETIVYCLKQPKYFNINGLRITLKVIL